MYATEYPYLLQDRGHAVPLLNDALVGAALDANKTSGVAGRVVVIGAPDFSLHHCFTGPLSWMVGTQDIGCLHPNKTGQAAIAHNMVDAILSPRVSQHATTAASLSPLDSVVWAGYNNGKVVLQTSAEAVVGKLQESIKFVGLVARQRGSDAAVRRKAMTVRRTVHVRRGTATVAVSVPRAMRDARTKVYVSVGRRIRCIRFDPSGACRERRRVSASPSVYLGRLGDRR